MAGATPRNRGSDYGRSTVEVTYRCPHCGALTSLQRDASLADKSVTEEPLSGYEYASTTDDDRGDSEARSASGSRTRSGDADGVEFVCIADADDEPDGCGRVFYLNVVKFQDGEAVDAGVSLEDDPKFDFLR